MLPDDLVGTVLDGKFQLEKALGSGAAGDVYEAINLGLNARVAVKVLRPGSPHATDTRRKRFVREARVAARLRSEHAVRVIDVVAPERGATYIVMELLDGETLAQRLRRTGRLPPESAMDFVLQAAAALGEMHDAGIVHRDVKPSNLFLTRDATGKEQVKILDFGIAALQEPIARGEGSITHDAVLGTPLYMAPEQVHQSSGVDARVDVWALGVTLYELIAGRPPFHAPTVHALLNQIVQEEPRSLLEACPEVAPGLAALIGRCLAKDPSARPENARRFAEELCVVADVSAPPELTIPRKRRILLPAGAAAIATAIVGVASFALSRPHVAATLSTMPDRTQTTIPMPVTAAGESPSPDPNVAQHRAVVEEHAAISERTRASSATVPAATPAPLVPSPLSANHRTAPAKPAPRSRASVPPTAARSTIDDDRIE
jgi:serine/threonine protein kinase